MSTSLVQWGAPAPQLPVTATLLPVAFEEARRRPIFFAAMFATIALGALFFGLTLSKHYSSSSRIMVDENTIALGKPSSDQAPIDRAAIAREIALSRKVMNEVLKVGGWMDNEPTALQQEQLIQQIGSRIDISSTKQLPNVVRISYSDTSPMRAYRVTKRLGELVISETLTIRASQSRKAYEFISSQVARYHRRLLAAETKLADFRRDNPDARMGSDEDSARRIAELRRAVDDARMDLLDAQAQEGALRRQLSRQSPLGSIQSRGSQIQMQVAELQAERNRLLMSFTERHPDVVRVDHQIRDLQQGLRSESARPTTMLVVPRGAASSGGNPAYGDMSNRLGEVRGRGAASASRVSLGQQLINEEEARSNRIASVSSVVSELTRDYELSRDVYQDLLRRRENAQVAMSLDSEQSGLSFRILEPAAIPLQPNGGLRLMHVAAIGLFLAVVAPVLFMLGMLKFDSRVRSPAQIEQLAGLPILGVIPTQHTQRWHTEWKRKLLIAGMLLMAVPLAYVLALSARWILAP